MPTWLVIVLAVLAPGGIITALIEKTRRENNRDHARNSTLLQSIDRKIDKVDERLHSHIEWHAHGDK
jgi:hypothetical protein